MEKGRGLMSQDFQEPNQESPDREFERKFLLARLRFNLETLALELVSELLSDGVTTTLDNLASALLLRVGRTVPRSKVVPWDLGEIIVQRVIQRVAVEIVREGRDAFGTGIY